MIKVLETESPELEKQESSLEQDVKIKKTKNR